MATTKKIIEPDTDALQVISAYAKRYNLTAKPYIEKLLKDKAAQILKKFPNILNP